MPGGRKGLAVQENEPTYAHQTGPSICAVHCWLKRGVFGRGCVEAVVIR